MSKRVIIIIVAQIIKIQIIFVEDKMPNNLSCFISYAHEDEPSLNVAFIRKFVLELHKHFPNWDVFFDEEVNQIGTNLINQEKKLPSYDTVVIFYTPTYRQKVLDTSNDAKGAEKMSGARREYLLIQDRIKKEGTDQFIIPIKLSGSHLESVPPDLYSIVYESQSQEPWGKFVSKESATKNNSEKIKRYIKNGRYMKCSNGDFYYLTDEGRTKINNILKSTYERTKCCHKFISPYSNGSIEDIEKLLFYTQAAERAPIPPECLVHLDIFDKIDKDEIVAIIGRRGSGKTTRIEAISTNGNVFTSSYKAFNKIESDLIPELDLFDFVNSVKKTSDNTLFSERFICRTYWQVFYNLHCVYCLWLE